VVPGEALFGDGGNSFSLCQHGKIIETGEPGLAMLPARSRHRQRMSWLPLDSAGGCVLCTKSSLVYQGGSESDALAVVRQV